MILKGRDWVRASPAGGPGRFEPHFIMSCREGPQVLTSCPRAGSRGRGLTGCQDTSGSMKKLWLYFLTSVAHRQEPREVFDVEG